MTCEGVSRTIKPSGNSPIKPIKIMMKRLLLFTAIAALGFARLASAQQQQPETQTQEQAKPLADLAKDEEARRKTLRKPAKVYTNENLQPAAGGAAVAPAVGAPGTAPSTTQPAAPEEPAAPGEQKDQKYWSGKMREARAALDRMQVLMDSLQSRVNALTNDLTNSSYPVRGQIEAQRNSVLAELERMKKEIDEQKKAITALEDDARRAGVPAGWLRGA